VSKNSCSILFSRGVWLACLVFIPISIITVPDNVHAQRFSLSLDDFSHLHTDLPWDTLKPPPLDRLTVGEHHRVPNFLASDFSRVREVEEYSLYAPLKITIRHPNHYRFGFEETREGAFIVLAPRDLSIPDLSIEVVFIDDLAERRRRESFANVWQTTIVTSINAQRQTTAEKKGLLNISIPVPLPSAVERIIGKGEETNIDISGRQSITFAGESRRVDPFIGAEGQQKQPLFPSLDLRQELDVRLQGQIGEKIHIQVDHSSSSVLQEQNRIRLNYQGFEDDIVQLIEMGNTSLSLPGSQLVSFSTSAQGLFGVKALAKVGPMDITAIASKEEGELSRATFTPRGGSIGQTEVRTINDVDFIKNVYFFLDHPPDDTTSINVFRRPLESSIELFQSVDPFEIVANPELVTFFGRAWVDSLGDGSDVREALSLLQAGDPNTPPFAEAQYRLMQQAEDYRFVLDSQDNSVVGIELVRAVPNTKVLAVRYVNEFGDTIGNFNDFSDTLALELIKPFGARPDNEFGYTWSYMMRHIYSLQLSNIDPTTLSVEILDFLPRLDRSVPQGSSVPWIRVFGLDRTDQAGLGFPDNQVDVTRNLIDFQRGLLTFPIFSPFNPSDAFVAAETDSQFAFTGVYKDIRRPEIYNQFLTDILSAPRFQIVVRAASTTRTFNINAFNISELSEVVRLDGRELARNRDYTINYDTGQVELQGAVLDELTPSSNITIDYEFKPFAGGGSSSLVGFNSLLTLSENAKFGTTWLYESKGAATVRPRLGEEPTRAVVGDVNTNLQYDPNFLTDLVNKLPLVDTDARSSVSFAAEVAVSFPDPNTLGEVFIDDFEGVEDSDLISLLRRSWYPASPPVDSTGTGTLEAAKREPIFWYNIEPDRAVTRRDLNPDLDERESTIVPTLDLEFDTLSVDPTHWSGVMGGFRGGGLDLTQGQFIEVWVNDFKVASPHGGILRIDLGTIDEDFYRPDVTPPRFDTEDKGRDGFAVLTDDTGLDGVFNGEPGDDADDDFESNRQPDGRFSKINGNEGNFQLDSEDLDGSGQLDATNAYFSYAVDLASEPVIDVRRDFSQEPRSGHENDSWRLYRVRLSDHARVAKDAAPSFGQIRHVRIWMENIGEVVNPQFRRVQIAGLKIVGNRWERDGIRTLGDSLVAGFDTVGVGFSLGVISTKTDPIDYIPPVNPNRQNDIAEKEQSLLVTYDSLQAGQSFRLRKRFSGRGLDLTNYRDVHLFVHTDRFDPSSEYFFRFAVDSLNYYEVSVPLTQLYFPSQNWARIAIGLTDLTDLKFEPADSVIVGAITDIVDNSRAYDIRMVGLPNLFTVRFLYAGLRNNGTQAVSGELWLDDIFLGNRRKDIDYAQRFGATVNLANVINVSGSWSRTGPDFRGLRQQRGSGADQQNLNLSVKTALGNFIPLFGFSIPVTGNYTRNLLLPKFTPNSDTEVAEDAIQDSLKTERVTRGFSTTLTRSGSRNPLMRYTFDKLKANFSLSQTRTLAPASADTSLNMSGTLDYSITWGAKRTIRLFRDVRFRYWFNSLNFRVNATRQTGQRYRNVGGKLVPDPSFFSAALGTSGQANYVPFRSLTTSLRMNVVRDVARPNEFFGIDIGTETRRDFSLQANFKPPTVWLIGVFSPDINFSSGYREDSSPNVRRAADPPGVKNIGNTRDTAVKLSFDVGKYFKKLFTRLDILEEEDKKRPPAAPTQTGGQDQARPDTTETPQEPAEGPDRLIAVRKVGGILSRIRKVNATLGQRFQSSYSRIPERPSLLYMLGVTDYSGVFRQGQAFDQPERAVETNTINLDSGVQITRNIDLSARFSAAITNTDFRSSKTKGKNMTWPDVNVSWTGIEQYGPLQGLFKTTSATVGFRSQTRETGRGETVESTEKNRAISPTMVFTWKNDLNTNLNAQFTKNTSETRGALNETTSMNIGMELKYSFQPGKALKLPFLKNKTLRSSLNTSLGMGYSRSGGKRSVLGQAAVDVPRRTSIRVAPRVAYNFTRALNGSFFVDYTRQYSASTNQTTTTVRVGIDATFTF